MLILSSSTMIKALTAIRRERILLHAGEVTVRVGQDVSPVQVVARASKATGYQILPASKVLEIRTQELEKHLLVKEGAALQRGMPLMRGKRNLLGKSKRYGSPIDGILLRIQNGTLILQRNPELLELRALMTGRVANVVPNQGVVLETSGSLIQAIWDSGKEGFGTIKMAVDEPHEAFAPDWVGADARGSVLVTGVVNSKAALQQAEENGVRGIITGSLPFTLARAAAKLSLPIIATDGIGQVPMAKPIFEMLQQSQDREASLFARTPGIRGRRPEIVIPVPAARAPDQSKPTGLLEAGKKVRILRAGNEMPIGVVVAVYPQARRTKIGTRYPGADVELEDGKVIFVPYTNLDLIV